MKKIVTILGLIAVLVISAYAGTVTNATWNEIAAFYANTGVWPVSQTNGILVNPSITGPTVTGVMTNTSQFISITNDFVAGGVNLIRNQRAIVTVTVIGSGSAAGGVWYSNAVTGVTRTYFTGFGTVTNTVTFCAQPNSQFAITNCTIIPNTSEIDYQ